VQRRAEGLAIEAAFPRVLQAQADGEVESAPLAQFALGPDASPHHLDQSGGDRQAQSSAAEPAGGRPVGLRERGEDEIHLVRRDALARVGHGEVQADLIRAALLEAAPDPDVTFVGELDCVAE